ncbi:MAG: hypothetical protein MUP24_01950 [Gillisia sp.]|nr:hypothetical protein [Gillisia sp.]
MKNIAVFLMLFTVISNQFVIAQEADNKNPILTSKFQLGVGMYVPSHNVKFSIDASNVNQTIEFDENFDFNSNQVTPEVFFNWRFAKKWNLYSEYFNANNSTRLVLKNDITAGDYTFNEGSNVKLGYKVNLYRIYFGRVISTGLKHELGGGLGAHILEAKPFIEGNIIVNGSENEFKRVSGSATAPLPNIALWYYYAPTQKWALTVRVDWFGLKINEYSGSLWDISPGVRYQIIKNLGVSLDYRYYKVNADVNKDSWNGGMDLSFSGPTFAIIGNL